MNYQIIYDFGHDGISFAKVVIGIILFVLFPVGVTWVYFKLRNVSVTQPSRFLSSRNINNLNSPWFLVVLAFCYLIVVGLSYEFYSDFLASKKAIESGTMSVVEGDVSRFHHYNAFRNRHTYVPPKDLFCIKNTCFTLVDSIFNVGYNSLAVNGSPIRNGLPVRINYIQTGSGKKIILRLETINSSP